MTDSDVRFEIDNRVGYITLNRPQKHNAFNGRVVGRLGEIVETLNSNEDVIATVLQGKGESFSAGADLDWMRDMAEAGIDQNREDALKLAETLYDLYTLEPTSISLVHGTAMGGALGLISCSDIVVAERSTTMGFSEVRLGLIPATISPYVISAIGQRQARRYFQTGETFSGDTAKELGLVHELVDSESELNDRLQSILDSIRENGPEAMKKAKKLCLDFGRFQITEEIIQETAERIANTRCSSEGQEGIRAFLEDRTPDWMNEDS